MVVAHSKIATKPYVPELSSTSSPLIHTISRFRFVTVPHTIVGGQTFWVRVVWGFSIPTFVWEILYIE